MTISTRTVPAKTLAAAAIGMTLLAGCGASMGGTAPGEATEGGLTADYPSYGSIDEASEAADDVVVATVLDARDSKLYPDMSPEDDPNLNLQAGEDVTAEELEELAIPIRITRVRVEQVLQGDLQVGDIVEVQQLGGTDDGVRQVEADSVLIEDVTAPEVVLLLETFGTDKPAALINPAQGIMPTDGTTVEALELPGALDEITTLDQVEQAVKD